MLFNQYDKYEIFKKIIKLIPLHVRNWVFSASEFQIIYQIIPLPDVYDLILPQITGFSFISKYFSIRLGFFGFFTISLFRSNLAFVFSRWKKCVWANQGAGFQMCRINSNIFSSIRRELESDLLILIQNLNHFLSFVIKRMWRFMWHVKIMNTKLIIFEIFIWNFFIQ